MKPKDKPLDILVVGSGLSSLIFIDKYLKKKTNLNIISPDFNLNKIEFNNDNDHIFKILPPQMTDKNKVKSYFHFNNILINKNCKLFGSLEFGGLSNYWGLQIDPNIHEDIKYLKKKTQKKIIKSFFEIMSNFRLSGKFERDKDIIDFSFKSKFFDNKNRFDKNLKVQELILGFENRSKKKNIENINEQKDKFIPKNFYKKYLKSKKIKLHNYYVKKIKKSKAGIEVICSNTISNKSFYTKKLVLGCGTLVSTKLILEYLNVKKEVKLNHHPRLFSLFFLKKSWSNNMIFQPSQNHIKLKKKNDLFTVDLRPGNKLIINSIIKFKKIMLPFKFFLNFFRSNMLFVNTFLHPKFGDLYLKLDNNNRMNVYSKNKNNEQFFNKISKMIYKFLRKQNKIFTFIKNYFPVYGADFHYFGTIPINGKGKLSVTENCQLTKDKNIYIIDNSVFNFKKNKYPIGLTLANARRIAEDLS